jgi:hypothetical protein
MSIILFASRSFPNNNYFEVHENQVKKKLDINMNHIILEICSSILGNVRYLTYFFSEQTLFENKDVCLRGVISNF